MDQRQGTLFGGRYDEVIEIYDEAININPGYAYAWNGKGLALDNQGEHEEALRAFDRAIELDPNFAMAWNNKGKGGFRKT